MRIKNIRKNMNVWMVLLALGIVFGGMMYYTNGEEVAITGWQTAPLYLREGDNAVIAIQSPEPILEGQIYQSHTLHCPIITSPTFACRTEIPFELLSSTSYELQANLASGVGTIPYDGDWKADWITLEDANGNIMMESDGNGNILNKYEYSCPREGQTSFSCITNTRPLTFSGRNYYLVGYFSQKTAQKTAQPSCMKTCEQNFYNCVQTRCNAPCTLADPSRGRYYYDNCKICTLSCRQTAQGGKESCLNSCSTPPVDPNAQLPDLKVEEDKIGFYPKEFHPTTNNLLQKITAAKLGDRIAYRGLVFRNVGNVDASSGRGISIDASLQIVKPDGSIEKIVMYGGSTFTHIIRQDSLTENSPIITLKNTGRHCIKNVLVDSIITVNEKDETNNFLEDGGCIDVTRGKLELHSITRFSDKIEIEYTKDFDECVTLFKTDDTMAQNGLYNICEKGEKIKHTMPIPFRPYSYDPTPTPITIEVGQSYKMCDGAIANERLYECTGSVTVKTPPDLIVDTQNSGFEFNSIGYDADGKPLIPRSPISLATVTDTTYDNVFIKNNGGALAKGPTKIKAKVVYNQLGTDGSVQATSDFITEKTFDIHDLAANDLSSAAFLAPDRKSFDQAGQYCLHVTIDPEDNVKEDVTGEANNVQPSVSCITVQPVIFELISANKLANGDVEVKYKQNFITSPSYLYRKKADGSYESISAIVRSASFTDISETEATKTIPVSDLPEGVTINVDDVFQLRHGNIGSVKTGDVTVTEPLVYGDNVKCRVTFQKQTDNSATEINENAPLSGLNAGTLKALCANHYFMINQNIFGPPSSDQTAYSSYLNSISTSLTTTATNEQLLCTIPCTYSYGTTTASMITGCGDGRLIMRCV